ncbi:MAG: hypothetical protein Q9198_010346 [Flavoplaca austrocitrina]
MLGLLNITMEIRYGEGIKAFMRLQRTLMETSTDESIFAWTTPPTGLSCYRSLGHTPAFDPKEWGLLAPSPDCFLDSKDFIVPPNLYVPRPGGGYQWGQQGVTFQMRARPGAEYVNVWGMPRSKVSLLLNCWRYGDGQAYCVSIDLARKGDLYMKVQCNTLGEKKGARPKGNNPLVPLTIVPMTIRQPEFDPLV